MSFCGRDRSGLAVCSPSTPKNRMEYPDAGQSKGIRGDEGIDFVKEEKISQRRDCGERSGQ
jgi:hypothetical protein